MEEDTASTPLYQIREWNKFFENHKSRIVEQCSFVCVPNKQDGMGLTRILSHENGLQIYGVWCLIVGACSRQRLPREGYLTDTGTALGRRWSAADMAERWRQSESIIQFALDVISSDRINWLEVKDSQVPFKCRPSAARTATNEGRNERKEGMNEGSCDSASPTRPPLEEGPTTASPITDRPTRKIANSDHAKLIDHFKRSWEKLYNCKFVFVDGKDGKHFQQILKHAECMERAVEIVNVYLADDSKFLVEKYHPVAILVSQISTYAAKAASSKANAKPTRKVGEKVVNWS